MNNNDRQPRLIFSENTTPTAWCEWNEKYLHPLRMTLLLFTCLIVAHYLWKSKERLQSYFTSFVTYSRRLISFIQHIIWLYLLSMNSFFLGKTVGHMPKHV